MSGNKNYGQYESTRQEVETFMAESIVPFMMKRLKELDSLRKENERLREETKTPWMQRVLRELQETGEAHLYPDALDGVKLSDYKGPGFGGDAYAAEDHEDAEVTQWHEERRGEDQPSTEQQRASHNRLQLFTDEELETLRPTGDECAGIDPSGFAFKAPGEHTKRKLPTEPGSIIRITKTKGPKRDRQGPAILRDTGTWATATCLLQADEISDWVNR